MNTKLLKRFRRNAIKEIKVQRIGNNEYQFFIDYGGVPLFWSGDDWVISGASRLRTPASISKAWLEICYRHAIRDYILYQARFERAVRKPKEDEDLIKLLRRGIDR